MPAAWAAASASAIWMAYFNASERLSPLRPIARSSVRPATYSIAMNETPASTSMSWTVTILG